MMTQYNIAHSLAPENLTLSQNEANDEIMGLLNIPVVGNYYNALRRLEQKRYDPVRPDFRLDVDG